MFIEINFIGKNKDIRYLFKYLVTVEQTVTGSVWCTAYWCIHAVLLSFHAPTFEQVVPRAALHIVVLLSFETRLFPTNVLSIHIDSFSCLKILKRNDSLPKQLHELFIPNSERIAIISYVIISIQFIIFLMTSGFLIYFAWF